MGLVLLWHLAAVPVFAQQNSETVTTVVLDSAPKKLYSELYSDLSGNRFLVEIYEEPQEGENLVHFRAFKNGSLLARKSQALADSHNFTFYIDESQERLMRPDVRELLVKALRRLLEESDEKQKKMLVELFNDEGLARNISRNLTQPHADVDEEQLAELLSGRIRPSPAVVDDERLAERLSRRITQPPVELDEEKLEDVMVSVLTQEDVAEKISHRNKPAPAIVDVDQLAEQLSGRIEAVVDDEALAEQLSEKVKPVIDDERLAESLSGKIKPVVDDEALAERLSSKVKPVVDDEALAARLTEQVKPVVDDEKLAERLSLQVKPVVDEAALARSISGKIQPSPVRLNEDALAAKLALRLTQREKLAAAKIPKYAELIKQVEEANKEKDYAKTIVLLDEDIARRTPDEQQQVLKISGLMSVLVASKKLKTALSTIRDYDLPEDKTLELISKSLEKWIQENLVVE